MTLLDELMQGDPASVEQTQVSPAKTLAERIAGILQEKAQGLIAPTSQPVVYDVSTNTRANRKGLQKALG